MIAIVDYGVGNLRSVKNAFERFDAAVEITPSPERIAAAEKIVLPGVGAFGDAMRELEKRNLIEVLKDSVRRGKPLLGICLGMQLLFTGSEEAPRVRGLSIFPGMVRRFPDLPDNRFKVPQIGWNTVDITQEACPFLAGVPPHAYFYFVHSYYVEAGTPVSAGETEYSERFTSIAWRANVIGTQFHPEKSQTIGLSIIKNFV